MLKVKAIAFALLCTALSPADLGDFFPMEKLSKVATPKLTTKTTSSVRVDGIA